MATSKQHRTAYELNKAFARMDVMRGNHELAAAGYRAARHQLKWSKEAAEREANEKAPTGGNR